MDPEHDVVTRRPGGTQRIPRPLAWRLVTSDPPAPHPLTITVEGVAERLDGQGVGRAIAPAFPGARPAAVLVALADGPSGAEVLLTRRAEHLSSHRGEISFPGGRMDPGETAVETARREAHEEVGLAPDLVEVVGELTHLSTVVSRSYIVPIVARLPAPLPLHAASGEVTRVLWTPLADLVRPDTYHAESWGIPPLARDLHFFDLDDETVWGATAAMLVDLLDRLA